MSDPTLDRPAHWSDALARLDACEEAVRWAQTQPDLAAAWRACERADWLLWLAGRTCTDGDDRHRAVVRAVCACARTVVGYAPAGETRPLRAIEAAEAWAAHPTLAAWATTRAAAKAAARAAVAAWAATTRPTRATAEAASAARVAWAAAGAARVAGAAAEAACAAAATAEAASAAWAARAAGAAAWAARAVGAAAQRDMADLVRQHILEPPEVAS